jgi:Protein of unknown function (DUF1579)
MTELTKEATKETPQETMIVKPQKQHQWLQKFVGEWTYEGEVLMGPDQPPEKTTGTESVRSLGDLWIVAEGQGEMPGCDAATTMMTLGYDPQKQRYVGTWVGSVMTYLWLYDGELNAEETVLTLNAEGPAMSECSGSEDGTADSKMAQYKDVVEFKSDDHRLLTSHLLGDNGQWIQFMSVHYRRQS